jgi:WD40 repeat protein
MTPSTAPNNKARTFSSATRVRVKMPRMSPSPASTTRRSARKSSNCRDHSHLLSASEDRFIPNRARIDASQVRAALVLPPPTPSSNDENTAITPDQDDYKRHVRRALFGSVESTSSPSRLLFFGNGPQISSLPSSQSSRLDDPFCQDGIRNPPLQHASSRARTVSTIPKFTLPSKPSTYVDCLNLVSCGPFVAVGIDSHVRITHGDYDQNCGLEKASINLPCSDVVASVKWSKYGGRVAVGASHMEVWDPYVQRKVMGCKCAGDNYVTALEFQGENTLLAAYINCIRRFDLRMKKPVASSQKFCFGRWPVTSLQWVGNTIAVASQSHLAADSEKGTIDLWDSRKSFHMNSKPLHTLRHSHPNGLGFCPFQSNTIASGGLDGIKLWNLQTGNLRGFIPTPSPVTSLLWSPHRHEIVASYGGNMGLWSVSSRSTCFEQLSEWTTPPKHTSASASAAASKVLTLDCMAKSGRIYSLHSDDSLYGWDAFGDPPPPRGCLGITSGLRTSGWLESAPMMR